MMMMTTRESWRAEDSLPHDAVWRIGMCIIYRTPRLLEPPTLEYPWFEAGLFCLTWVPCYVTT